MVKVRPIGEKRLLGVAGSHAVITDRKIDDGGSDVGCTSGELLLLAIGSCATGSLRNYLEKSGLPADRLEVNVDFAAPAKAGDREAVAITINLPKEVLDGNADKIVAAAQSGRVVSRIKLGSPVIVLCQPQSAS